MKITCQSCQAKYTIADEKVAGKTVKIKCKKCGATIVVSGSDAGAAAPVAAPPAGYPAAPPVAAAPPGDDEEGEGATRVFSEGSGMGGPDEWTVNVTDEDQRTLSGPQILMEFQRGVITADTYVWKDGMGDWLPISDVPELMRLVAVGRPAAAARPAAGMPAPAPVMPDLGPGGLGGTMIMNEPIQQPMAASPAAPPPPAGAAAPAAARRSGKGAAVDLFASGQHEMAPSAPVAAHGGDRQVGERNENSVLFSISALTAAAGAGKHGDDPFDLAAPAPGKRGRENLDDIMNLGGGMSGPMLAPPPLLAPVVEAPPPPPVAPPPQQHPYGAPAMSAVPAMRMDAPPAKSKAPLILGIVGVVAVLGGVGAFFALRGGSPPPAPTADATSTTAATAAPSAASTAPLAATTQPAETAKPADTAAAAATTTPSASATAVVAAANTGKPAVGGPLPGKGPDKAPDPKPEKTAETKPDKAPDPPPAKTADAKPADTGGGKEFDRAAAMSALGAASGAARGCKKEDGPTGTARVKVTFAPSGSVTSASVDGPPFAGTAVGGCIAGAFRGAHVPSFDGSPVTVTKSISIN